MLNANMIEKVEVMTTPSAKYNPDGMAGIINIVLSKNEFVGKSGSLSFNNSFFEGKKFRNNDEIKNNKLIDGGQNLSGTINYFKNDWNIFTTYGFNFKKRQRTGERNTVTLNMPEYISWGEDVDNETLDETNVVSKNITNMYPEKTNLKMGIERYPNDKALIAFDLTYIKHSGIDTTTVRGNYESVTITEDDGDDLNYGFGYFFENKETNKNFSVEFDYDDHSEIETESTYGDVEFYNKIEDVGIDQTLAIDYSSPLYGTNSKYETGLKISTGDDSHAGIVYNENFDWKYDNLIAAGYVTASYNISDKFAMQIGARYEEQTKESIIQYDKDFDCDTLVETQETSGFCDCSGDDGNGNWTSCTSSLFQDLLGELGDNLSYEYDHNRIYPSLFFKYDTQNRGSIKFALSRRIERPWHRALNPIPDLSQMSSLWIRQGNPYLEPEDIYVSEIIYSNKTSIGFLKTTFFINQVDNKIDKDTDTYLSTSGQIYTKFTNNNVAESNGSGLDLFFMTQPLPNWDLMFNGTYWHDELEGLSYDQQGDEYGFWGMINSTIRLKNDQEIGVYSHFSSPMKITVGEIEPMRRMDLTYKKKVNEKFNFKIKLKDVFDKSQFSIDTLEQLEVEDGNPGFDQEQNMIFNGRWGQRTLSINLEYRFGAFQKKKYRRDDGGPKYDSGGQMDVGF